MKEADKEAWKVEVFKKAFNGRTDVYAVQVGTGYSKQDKPMDDESIKAHIKGDTTIAQYVVRQDGKCGYIVFDVDIPKGKPLDKERWDEAAHKIRKVIQCGKELGLPEDVFHIEHSGRRGYHLWIFFDKPIPSQDTHGLGSIIKKSSGIDAEVFPKKRKVSMGEFGSSIKLPLGIHKGTGKRSHFVDKDFGEIGPDGQYQYLEKAKRMDTGSVGEIIREHGKENPGQEDDKKAMATKHGVENMVSGCDILTKLRQNAEKEHHLTYDERLVFAGQCVGLGKAGEEAVHGVMAQCSNYEFSKTDRQMKSMQGYTPMSCRGISARLNMVCPEGCPLKNRVQASPTWLANDKLAGMTDEEYRESMELLENPEMFSALLEDAGKLGCVGEEDNVAILFLAFTSRKMDSPLRVLIKSEPSAGKNYILGKVAELIPDEDKITVSEITPKALNYYGGDMRHKAVIIHEMVGGENCDYAIRTLLSEDNLVTLSAMKNAVGRIRTEEIRVEGPIALFLTTTKMSVNNENETRFMEMNMDESDIQTVRVIKRDFEKAKGFWLPKDEEDRIKKRWQNAQRLLMPYKIVIPFADKIDFPSHPHRVRRDVLKFLSIINASALLHQFQRERTERNGEECIVASLNDYTVAFRLFVRFMDYVVRGISAKIEDVVNIAKELSEIDVAGIAEKLGCSVPTAQKYLKEAVRLGYLAYKDKPKQGVKSVYEVGKPIDEIRNGITTPEQMEKIINGGETPEPSIQENSDNLAGVSADSVEDDPQVKMVKDMFNGKVVSREAVVSN